MHEKSREREIPVAVITPNHERTGAVFSAKSPFQNGRNAVNTDNLTKIVGEFSSVKWLPMPKCENYVK